MKRILFACAALALTTALAIAADNDNFTSLFNGKDTTGWHLRNPKGHNSWTVENGILKNTVNKGEHGTDLVTDRKFWNFTLRYEFQVPDGSNSGLYLRGRHELQILGDDKSGQPALGGNGPSTTSRRRMSSPRSRAASGRRPRPRSSGTRSPSF